MKHFVMTCGVILCICICAMSCFGGTDDYIKYAEFNVTYEALKKAVDTDISTHDDDTHISCIELLAFLGANYGGDFSKYSSRDMDSLIEKLKSGEDITALTQDMKYYDYYYSVYSAVLGSVVGEYTTQRLTDDSGATLDEPEPESTVYGIKAYSPIAATFPYCDYDDFGAGRSYGYARRHLGHDLMAATGTPVVAIESGIVECIGWNQYGGWRIGIRSFDKKRYYYYAHLRQNRPYHCDIKEGCTVKAGDVIGYVGRTGYSANENVNGITQSHLHIGLELVFDEAQKECDNEIWVDMYAITRLLSSHKSEVYRVPDTKEFYRIYSYNEK